GRPNMSVNVRISWSLVLVVVLAFVGGHPASAGPKDSKVNPALTALYAEHQAHAALGGDLPFVSGDHAVNVVGDWVVFDAVADTDAQALEADLASLGATNLATFGRVVSGRLPISAIPGLEAITNLRFVQASYGVRGVGAVTTQGDPAQRSDLSRQNLGLTG